MRRSKEFIAILLAVLITITYTPAMAFADESVDPTNDESVTTEEQQSDVNEESSTEDPDLNAENVESGSEAENSDTGTVDSGSEDENLDTGDEYTEDDEESEIITSAVIDLVDDRELIGYAGEKEINNFPVEGDKLIVTYNDGSIREYVAKSDENGWVDFVYQTDDGEDDCLGYRFKFNDTGRLVLGANNAELSIGNQDAIPNDLVVQGIESDVESIEYHQDQPYLLIVDDNYSYYDEDEGGYIMPDSKIQKGDTLTINYKDGTTETYKAEPYYSGGVGYTYNFRDGDSNVKQFSPSYWYDSDYEKTWEIGGTYTKTISYHGAETTFEVTLAENPVKSISFTPNGKTKLQVSELTYDGVFSFDCRGNGTTGDESFTNGRFFTDGDKVSVTWTDDTVTEYTYSQDEVTFVDKEGNYLPNDWEMRNYEKCNEDGDYPDIVGVHTVWIEYYGAKSDTFTLTVIEDGTEPDTPSEDEGNVRETDVTEASDGNILVYYEGEFNYLSKDDILAEINKLRLEACQEGVPNPSDASVALTEADYTPIKWSSDLEWIAQTRAAEGSLYKSHTRPNNASCFTTLHNGTQSWGEVLAWNSGGDILRGINQWYGEKADWVNQTEGATTGHYTQMIDPSNTYVGIGSFYSGTGYGCVAGEFSYKTGLDETQADKMEGTIRQKVEILKENLTLTPEEAVTVHFGKTAEASIKGTATYGNVTSSVIPVNQAAWASDDTSVATVDSKGTVTGVKPGTAHVTATIDDIECTFDVTVEDHTAGEAVRENEVAATCSKEGSYDEVVKCSVCGEEISRETKKIEKLAHTPAEAVRENEVAATCSKEGSYDEVVKCSVCGEEISRETKTIEKLAHTPAEAVRENEVAATCSKEGSYDEVVKCSVCGEEISRETKTIEKLAHTPAEAVRENEVAATCSKEGSYDEVVKCSVCGEEISRETKKIEKLAHTPAEAVREKVVEATCSKEGSYDEVVYCSVCGEEISRETKKIEKLAHTPAEAVKEKVVEATCTKEGSYDEVVYCSVCGEELSRETKTIEKVAHTPKEAVIENEVAATCEAEGSYDEVVYCSICGEELSRTTKTIAKLIDINAVTVSGITNKTFNGKAQTQALQLTYGDETLAAGTDYTVAYSNNKNAGTAQVTITGTGKFGGSTVKTFTINKANNPLTVKAKTATVKYKKLKKKNQTVAATKAFAVSKAQGKVTYKKKSGNKKIVIASNGKITVKKKLKKGTYKVKVAVTAAGNANYKAVTKVVTIKIKVK